MDNKIGRRIKEIRKGGGYSQKEFAKIFGLKDAVTISRWENGYRKPEYDVLMQLTAKFNINLHWLLTGSGKSVNLYDDTGNVGTIPEEFKAVPCIDIYASAGGGYINVPETENNYMLFRKEWLIKQVSSNLDSLVIFTVEGDSMWPTLQSGDLIMIDKNILNVEKEGIYVILYDDLLMVKRVQLIIEDRVEKIKLISDNKLYESFTIPVFGDENIKVIGKVVWFGRKI